LLPNTHFDLAVIGAGPAGSTAAIAAARLGIRVALFEARDFPRHKVCGEFVSAESLEVLRFLLQDSPATMRLLRRAPVIDRTRLFLGERMIEAELRPAALSITRHDLDAQLWSAAQSAGAVTFANCEISAIGGDGPFVLTTSSTTFSARALIIAAGRWSQFAPDRSIPPGPRWIGLKCHFRESRPSQSTDLYFFEGGYCGVQPVGDDVVNACTMVRSDVATSLRRVLALHPRLEQRAANWNALIEPLSTAPLIYRVPEPVRGNIVFAGDAAAFIDPFVGDGISIALRSGRMAAECVASFLAGERTLTESLALYERKYSRRFAPLIAAASRVRSLLSLPGIARGAAFEFLRLPGVMPFLIRKTRRAS
jgi:flavin-dependent dehydrogenase